MRPLERIANAVSDHANPVVVKELRQAVQSRLVIAILLLFLLANVVGVCGYLTLNTDVQSSERAGLDLFNGLYVLLVITCMLFVPLYTAVRMSMERNDSNMDLVFITTIPPAQIIRGKFWSAVAITSLIYSACMPFLTLTFLLRGIDLPSIFLALGLAFLSTIGTSMMAIFVGSVTGGMLLRLILAGVLLQTGSMMVGFTIASGVAIAEGGIAFLFDGWEAWVAVGIGLLMGLGTWGLLYLLSVAAVSPKSSNRMYPVRVYLTICWFVAGVIAAAIAFESKELDMLLTWTVGSMIVFYIIMPIVLAERETWTSRVRRTIPRRFLPRAFSFLLYTGSAGGILWNMLLAVSTLLITGTLIIQPVFASARAITDPEELVMNLVRILMYCWCYSMTGLFLRRLFLPRSPALVGTVLGLILLGLLGTAPLVAGYLIYGPYRRLEDLPVAMLLPNPFIMMNLSHSQNLLDMFLVAWSALILLLNLPWFKKQWKEFVRHEPKGPDTLSLPQEQAVVHV